MSRADKDADAVVAVDAIVLGRFSLLEINL